MGKVISLKEEAFKRMGKTAHATTVYVHNMDNKQGLTQAEPIPQTTVTPSKGFIPFGTPVPREWTLVGAFDKLKPGVK